MANKIVNSNYRIMKIFRLLREKPSTIDELCFELDLEEQGVQRGTITKYFSVLRSFGCTIEKYHNKFYLLKSPFDTPLTEKEIETLAQFYNFANSLCDINKSEDLKEAFSKILKGSNFEDFVKHLKLAKEKNDNRTYLKYEKIIRKICMFLDDNRTKIKILYKNSYYTVTPKKIKYSNDKVYLKAFDENKLVNKIFSLEDIKEIINLGQISTRENFIKPTVFKLKGRVANGYTNLYEGETVLERDINMAIIQNKAEDKDVLLHRLLKYCEFCEVISPIEDKIKYEKLVEELFEKYSTRV